MLAESRVVDRPPAEPRTLLPGTTLVWVILVVIALSALGFGLFAFTHQTLDGFIVTGLRNPGYGAGSWGLYIAFDVFFVGVSFAGITVAAICRLFRIAVLEPVTRIAELLTITALLAGAGVVLADLGRPDVGLINLPKFANPSSPFYGTFTLVLAGYLFSSLVYFFLAGRPDAAAVAKNPGQPGRFLYQLWASGFDDRPEQRARHHRVSFWLALTILPLLVTAHSTLGFIFGLQSGRPGWFSALQAPAFVVLAGVSGTGLLIAIGLGFRRLFRLHDRLPDATFRWLGQFLWILALVYIYFTIVDEMTSTYAAPEADRHLAHELVTGEFAPIFWTYACGLFLTFLLPFILYLRGEGSVVWLGVAGITANIAAVCKRFLIVVPSQTHGSLLPIERARMYHPTWVEYGVVLGLFGLMFVAMLMFGRVFPLIPAAHGHDAHGSQRRDLRRIGAAGLTACAALVLIAFGLTDSFRLWSGNEIDPRVHFSPVVFATGVMTLFISAIVYEVFPERRPSSRQLWEQQKRAIHAGALPWDATAPAEQTPALPSRGDVHQLVELARAAEHTAARGDAERTYSKLEEIERAIRSMRRKG